MILLLGLNYLAQLIWLFGFHNERLALLVITGFSFLGLFMLYVRSVSATILKACIVLFLLIGIINAQPGFYVRAIADLSALGIISSAFLIRYVTIQQLKNLIQFIFVCSTVYFIYTLFQMDLTLIGANIDRVEAFNQFGDKTLNEGGAEIGYIIYASQQYIVSVFGMCLLLLPLVYTKDKSLKWGLMIAIGLIYSSLFIVVFQKRQPILELSLILLSFGIFYKESLVGLVPKSRFMAFTFVTLLLIGALSLNIFSATLERLLNTAENLSDFDRFTELKYALNQFSFIDYIIGKGLGSQIQHTAGATVLHIGYGTLLMKGGILLLLFYLSNTFYNIMFCIKRSKKEQIYNVGTVISLFSLVQLALAPGWSWYITSIIMGLAMFSRFPLSHLIYDKYYYSGIKR